MTTAKRHVYTTGGGDSIISSNVAHIIIMDGILPSAPAAIPQQAPLKRK
jgi:hypothetical protein